MSIRVTTLEEPVIEKNVTVMADESLGGCASGYTERFEYKKATMEDVDELVRTRIIVLRAANKLSDDVDMLSDGTLREVQTAL